MDAFACCWLRLVVRGGGWIVSVGGSSCCSPLPPRLRSAWLRLRLNGATLAVTRGKTQDRRSALPSGLKSAWADAAPQAGRGRRLLRTMPQHNPTHTTTDTHTTQPLSPANLQRILHSIQHTHTTHTICPPPPLSKPAPPRRASPPPQPLLPPPPLSPSLCSSTANRRTACRSSHSLPPPSSRRETSKETPISVKWSAAAHNRTAARRGARLAAAI